MLKQIIQSIVKSLVKVVNKQNVDLSNKLAYTDKSIRQELVDKTEYLVPSYLHGKSASEWQEIIDNIVNVESGLMAQAEADAEAANSVSTLILSDGTRILVQGAVGALTIVEQNGDEYKLMDERQRYFMVLVQRPISTND